MRVTQPREIMRLNLNWGRATELLTAGPPSARVISRTHMSSTPYLYQGMVEVMDLQAGFNAKTLKASKAEDRVNACILDKATKSDAAAVPKHLWNKKIAETLSQEWGNQLKPTLDFSEPGNLLHSSACAKADDCSWWTWDKGSAIFGLKPMFDGPPPLNADRQPPYLDPSIKALVVKEKLSVVIDKGYIELTDIKFVEAMMFMFHVPKGKTGVRIVYLLNFLLHPDLRKYCRVDLSHLLPSAPNEPGGTGVWMRNAMSLKSSPHNSREGSLRAKPWDWVCLNIPGMESYDPTQPWISKLRSDGLDTTEITQYLDDAQITAPMEDLALECSSKMAKGLCWLGLLQDAARKQRSLSQEPGAWVGAMVSVSNGQVCKGVTKERWIKLQDQIRWIALQVNMLDKHTKAGLCGNDVYIYGPLPQGTVPHPEFLETPLGCKGILIIPHRHLEDGVPLHLPQGIERDLSKLARQRLDQLQVKEGRQVTSALLWVDLEARLLCEATGGSPLEMACLDTFQQEMPVVPTTTHGILRPCHLCFDVEVFQL
eukprot:jgi/Psemu1/995/gm1.995_g